MLKVLEIGANFADGVKHINFLSDSYILDDDLLIVDLQTVSTEIHNSLQLSGGVAHHTRFNEVGNQVMEQKTKLLEFYKHNGNVILILNHYPIISIRVRNANSAVTSTEIDLLKIFYPTHDPIKYIKQNGETLEFDNSFEELKSWCKFNFQTLIEDNKNAKSLMWTKKAKSMVAFSVHIENGILIAIPGFRYDGSNIAQLRHDVFKGLVTLQGVLKKATIDDSEQPEWIKEYRIGQEHVVAEQANEIENKIDLLRQDLKEKTEVLDHYNHLKTLLYLDGTLLEEVVKGCLIKLGFGVEQPPGNDVDLIVQEHGFAAVIEVKGVSKSGAKNHVRQLENWVSNYSIQHNADAKGILILNSYKNTPINERTEIDFPPDMVEYSKQRNHCLLLTKDLLNILIDFEQNKIEKKDIIKLLSECSGVLSYSQAS